MNEVPEEAINCLTQNGKVMANANSYGMCTKYIAQDHFFEAGTFTSREPATLVLVKVPFEMADTSVSFILAGYRNGTLF